MHHLESLLATMRVAVTIHHNGQYCGDWNVDSSGSQFINFHLISHGSCYLRLDGEDDKVNELHAGDMVIFPTDCKHCMSNSDAFSSPVNSSVSKSFDEGEQPDGTGLLCGYFSYEHPLMVNILQQLPPAIILRNTPESKTTLPALLDALIIEAKSSGSSENWMLNKIAESVMALLFTQYLSGSKGILAGMSHHKIQNAVQAILEEPAQKWTVDELANRCFMSRTAFSATFNRVMEMPPIEFVTSWRLSLAYHQLLLGELSMLQIAMNAGYDNESSFSKAFKRVMGIPPGAVKSASVE